MANPAELTGPAQGRLARALLLGAVLLTGLTILSAGTGRLTGLGTQQPLAARPVETLALRFTDRADGAVVVTEATSGALVHLVQPGADGFIRGTMRGFVRERKRSGYDDGPPFHLVRWTDGTLTLEDGTTGRRIGLDAFGVQNAGVFAAFFMKGSTQK